VTHLVDEASFIADRVMFLNKNRLTGEIENISNQTVQDFIKEPPSLDAFRISGFPMVNVLGVVTGDFGFQLDETPDMFFGFSSTDVPIYTDMRGSAFNKSFETDTYALYRDLHTHQALVISTDKVLPHTVYLDFTTNNFKTYLKNGMAFEYAGHRTQET